MTRKQQQIDDTRQIVAHRAGYRCEVCGKPTPLTDGQMAHRIPQRKHNLRLYGAAVIHHPLNIAWTCSLECNGKVSLGEHRWHIQALASEIIGAIHDSKESSSHTQDKE